MPWNPFRWRRDDDDDDDDNNEDEEEINLEGGYYDEDGNWINLSEQADAIYRIVNDPDFDAMDQLGHVPHTPYRQENPNDPDTGPLRRR